MGRVLCVHCRLHYRFGQNLRGLDMIDDLMQFALYVLILIALVVPMGSRGASGLRPYTERDETGPWARNPAVESSLASQALRANRGREPRTGNFSCRCEGAASKNEIFRESNSAGFPLGVASAGDRYLRSNHTGCALAGSLFRPTQLGRAFPA